MYGPLRAMTVAAALASGCLSQQPPSRNDSAHVGGAPAAAAHVPAAARDTAQVASRRVPAAPPDTTPAWIHAPANLARDPEASFPFYADVIAVNFVQSASQAERQAAIDSVGGMVVGGIRYPGGDGIYYVRIDAGRRIAPLTAAFRKLMGMPQVAAVSFLTLMDGSRLPQPDAGVSERAHVPAIAPDTMPAWMLSPANLVDDDQVSFAYYADMIAVGFREGASQPERQAAVDAVGGMVIGGDRRPGGDGSYFVRIKARRAIAPLTAAVRALLAMPQVSAASFVTPAGDG